MPRSSGSAITSAPRLHQGPVTGHRPMEASVPVFHFKMASHHCSLDPPGDMGHPRRAKPHSRVRGPGHLWLWPWQQGRREWAWSPGGHDSHRRGPRRGFLSFFFFLIEVKFTRHEINCFKVSSSVAFSAFTHCAPTASVWLWNTFIPQRKPGPLSQWLSLSPLHPCPHNHCFAFCCYECTWYGHCLLKDSHNL